MAFQPSGPCSSSPYKCLHVISSELYKSILNNNAKCDGNTDSSSNSSAYSAPNIQNNFYPSNNQFFDNPDNDNKKPPSDDQSASPDSPSPGLPPRSSPPDLPSEDNVSDNADSPDMPGAPNGVLTESPQISSDQNSEINGTVSGVGEQTPVPPTPNAIKIKRLKRQQRLKNIQNQPGRSRRKKRPLGSQNIQQQAAVTADVPQGATPMDASNTPQRAVHEPSTAQPVAKFPDAAPPSPPAPLTKIKSDVKLPSFGERKPDVKEITKKSKKEVKPLVKRKVNFDRKLPTILETDEPPQQETKPKVKTELKTETTVPPSPNPLSKIKTKVKWPSFEERKPDVKAIPKKVVKNETNPPVKRKVNFERNLVDMDYRDSKTKVKEEVKINTPVPPPSPPPLPPLGPKLKVELKAPKLKPEVKMDTTDTPKKDFIKIPTNPPKNAKWVKTSPDANEEMDTSNDVRNIHENEFKMRFDGAPYIDEIHHKKYPQIMNKNKKPTKKVKKGPISVRKDIFIDSKAKVKDRMAVNIFKSNNESEMKKLAANKPIIKKEKINHIKGEKAEPMEDVEFIDVPFMPQHAAPPEPKMIKNSNIRKMKRVIENHPNQKTAKALKKELIEDMQHVSGSSKRKNPSYNRKREENNFGYTKSLKTKHEKKEGTKDEKSGSVKKEKKFYGSGFRKWKC